MFVAAFGHVISPVDLLTAYGLANILAAIPITPGGLGVVEFVLVSMLAGFGLTDGQALSAVLAYRAVNFWLPIPFGGLAYASLELEHRSVRIRREAADPAGLQARATEVLATAFARTGRSGGATSDAAAAGAARRRGDRVARRRSARRDAGGVGSARPVERRHDLGRVLAPP